MKKYLLVLCALVITLLASSQEQIKEGVITISQKMSSDNQQMNSQISMMGDMITTTYFNNDKSRTEISSPMTGDMIVITDGSTKEMITFMNNPMLGKKYVKGSLAIADSAMNDIVITKGDKIKTIMNYRCQQYFINSKIQGQPMELEVFTTDAINAYSQQTAPYSNELKGFPLFSTMKMNQMGVNITVTSEVTEIKKQKVLGDRFDMKILDGYDEMKQNE